MHSAHINIPDEVVNRLLPHQPQHVRNLVWILDEKQRTAAIDGSDTGTGKTYTTCAVAKVLGLSLLVMCPKPAVPAWYRVASRLEVNVLGVVNYETLQNNKYYESLTDFYDEKRVHCPYVSVTREHARDIHGQLLYTPKGRPKMKVTNIVWHLPDNVLVISDEAHKGKSGFYAGQTVNNKIMVSIRPALNAQRRIFALLLSATLTDKSENFDMAGYVVGLYQPHMKRVFDRFLNKVARKFNNDILGGLNKLIYPHFGSRMTIDDIQLTQSADNPIFRKSKIKSKAYRIDRETAAKIEYIHRQIQQYLTNLRAKGMPEKGWGYIIRCWQKIELLKVPLGIRRIKKHYHKGRSVAVFISYKQTKHSLLEGISKDCAAGPKIPINEIEFIDGDQKADDREDVVTDFQDDRLRVLICQIKAGGTALSLHDVLGLHPRSSIIFPTWSAVELKQALGRVDRANSKSQAIQEILFVKPPGMEPDLPSESEITGPTSPKLRIPVKNDKLNDMLEFDVQITMDDIPELIQNMSQLESKQLTVEEQICGIVAAKLDNIDMLNNGHLLGENLFATS